MEIIKKDIKINFKHLKPAIYIILISLFLALIFTLFQIYILGNRDSNISYIKQKNNTSQIGSALENYFNKNNSKLPDINNCNWEKGSHFLSCLKEKGYLSTIPEDVANKGAYPNCFDAGKSAKDYQNGYCYDVNPLSDYAVVYTTIDPSICSDNKFVAFYVWSTADQKSGIVCLPQGFQPTPGNQIFLD